MRRFYHTVRSAEVGKVDPPRDPRGPVEHVHDNCVGQCSLARAVVCRYTLRELGEFLLDERETAKLWLGC